MKKRLLLVLLFGLASSVFADTIWVISTRYSRDSYEIYKNMTYISITTHTNNSLYAKPNTYTINYDSGILFVWDKDGIEHIYRTDWEIERK